MVDTAGTQRGEVLEDLAETQQFRERRDPQEVSPGLPEGEATDLERKLRGGAGRER